MASLTIPGQSLLATLPEKINDSLEQHFWRWASAFLLALLISSIATDIRSKMWMDELLTLYVAQQAGPAQIIKAIKEGCDGSPPLYSIIVHTILPIVKNEALAVRLPSTLGFCGMAWCLFAFCRRRLPAIYTFIVSLIPCYVCLYYATEGRPYGITLGGGAGALLSWQAAAEGRRRGLSMTLLAFCLALMIATHYYCVFFLVPLFLAEMERARVSRKLDFGMLAAMVPALLVLALHYPLIEASKPFQEHFWSPANLRRIQLFYSSLFFQPLLYVFVCALIVLAVFSKPARQSAPALDVPLHEWVAVGALALMAPAVVFISIYVGHAFTDRYIIWSLIGLAFLAGAVLYKAAGGRTAVGVAVLGVLIALIARQEFANLHAPPVLRDGEAALHQLETLPDGPERVVIIDDHVFIELSYYAPPNLRERLVYVASRDLDLRFYGTDTGALLLLALSHRTKLHVQPYDAFLAEHPEFILSAGPFKNFLAWHLLETGYRVTPLQWAPQMFVTNFMQPVVFQVEAPNKQ